MITFENLSEVKKSEFFVFGFKVEYLKEFSQTFKIQYNIARSSTSTDGSFVSGF